MQARKLGFLAVVALESSHAWAQTMPPMVEGAVAWEDLRVEGEAGALLSTRWGARQGGSRKAKVALQGLDKERKPSGAAVVVHDADAVLTSLSLRPGTALVTLLAGGASPSIKAALVPINGKGEAGAAKVVSVPRKAGSAFVPAYAVSCADPEGFALLWQEYSATQGPAEVRSYLGRLKPDGSWLSAPAQVEVPWGFGAMAWNGKGYHLALYFNGGQDTRLNLVTLSPAGAPEQHPWWASRAEDTGPVQLLLTSKGMHAVYRSKGELHAVLWSKPGQWGAEPPAPRSLGALAADAPFALRAGADGEVEVVRKP